jgi:hypothetical protein
MGLIIVGVLGLLGFIYLVVTLVFGLFMPGIYVILALIVPQAVTFSCIEMTDRRWFQYVLILILNFILMLFTLYWVRNYPAYSQLGILFIFGLLLALLVKGENLIRTRY